MNPFLKPVHESLTSEFRLYQELRDQVNEKIKSGVMNAGCHDSCSYSWFDELWQTGYAEKKIEPIMRGGVQKGSRIYFRLPSE